MPTTYYPYDNGTVGPTGPEGPQGPAGPPGANGVVQSVNGQSVENVVLTATDVNALPADSNAQLNANYLSINREAGNYRAVRFQSDGDSRWEVQVDDAAETGSNAGSDLRISARNDDGSFNKTTMHARRSDGTVAFGLTTHHGEAQVTVNGAVGVRDVPSDPAVTSGGVFLYSKGGVPFFKNADGTSFQVQPVSYPVNSVNGATGNVTLGAADVGALPATDGEVMQTLPITGAGGSSRTLAWRTNSVNRWTMAAGTDPETGTDATGSNLALSSRNDDGSYRATVLDANRSTGQVSIGGGVKLSDAKLTVVNGMGIANRTDDPATPPQGFVLYAKDGEPYVIQADGTTYQIGAGGAGAVQSVNGKTGIVELDAEDVGAVPIWGGTVDYSFGVNAPTDTEYASWYYKKQGLTRWVMQANGTSETGGDAGTDWSLSAYDDSGNWKAVTLAAKRATNQVGIGTSTMMDGAALTVNGGVGLRNLSSDPVTSTAGAQVYSKGGLLYVKQADGTVFQVQPGGGAGAVSSVNGQTGDVTITLDDLGGIEWSDRGVANGIAGLDGSAQVPAAQLPSFAKPGEFDPTDVGLKAWSSDPAACSVEVLYPTSGTGRVTAVKVNETMSVSRIVWYFKGYAGGLKSGSWAGIYNTSGTLMRATGDLSTASYEPQEQHASGGGTSYSNLTSPVTLTPGIYYVVFRMVYTESPVDGPAILCYDNSSACPSKIGLNNVWRWATLPTSATSAPSSITPSSFVGDPKRFWVALA